MRTVLNVMAGATGTGSSEIVDLSQWTPAVLGDRVLQLDWTSGYISGTWTSTLIQQCPTADGTYATLWDLSCLRESTATKRFYDWDPFLKVTWGYTVGTDPMDAGARFRLGVRVYGLPNWRIAQPCRWDHFASIAPTYTDTAANFQATYPAERALAKLAIENDLRGRGIDPDKLFLDADASEQVPEGLGIAGAWKTLSYVLLRPGVVKSEFWKDEVAEVDRQYQAAFDAACSGGLMIQDTDGDVAVSESENVVSTLRMVR